MANFLYDSARERFLNGLISWQSGAIKLVLVDTSYTPNQETHLTLESVSQQARIATSNAFTNKGTAKGVASAADVTLTIPGDKVNVGVVPKAIIIYHDYNGVAEDRDSQRFLIAYIDTAAGLGETITNTQMKIAWNTGSNKIFKL